MRRTIPVMLATCASVVWLAAVAPAAGVPEPGANPGQEATPRAGEGDGERRAVPRTEAPERRADAEQRRAQPRRVLPPQRQPPRRAAIPQRRIVEPRRYHFPPFELRLGFYYHPYFGFYYGPYYGPFYPYSGPYAWPERYMSGAIRTRVQPIETEVYVDGYYAGIADDFDGVFQRLYLPAGRYEIELRLEGYTSFSRNVYVRRADTLELTHRMEPLGPGATPEPLPTPRPVPDAWPEPEPSAPTTQPASPYGMLALQVTPADAQVLVDGEAWLAIEGLPEIVIHLPAGWHQIDVRKDGYRPFSTKVDLSEGQTTRLSVTLTP